MAKLQVTVCDVCKVQGKEAVTYTIEGAGKRAVVDLCDDDSAPLRGLLEKFSVARKRSATRVRAARYERLLGTMDEIEASKKKAEEEG